MIVAWMSYTLLVGALLFAGAIAAELVSRALRLPTRFVWVAAMVLSIALPVRAIVLGTRSPRPMQSATVTAAPRSTGRVLETARAAVALSGRAIETIGDARPLGTDRPIAIALVAIAVSALSYLAIVALGVRRIARSLEARSVDGHVVLVSNDLGPALLGVLRPRTVIPRWVLLLDEPERRVILAHEQQHAEAGDPAMVAGAASLLALAPWNVALWAMFARLRLAIEMDCDRRVLAVHRDARRYGELLVSMYERTTTARMQLAFVARRSNLERRIRHLVERGPRLASARGASALLAGVMLVLAACGMPVPTEGVADSLTVSTSVVGALPRCVKGGFGGDALETFANMKAQARKRHPGLFTNIQGRAILIGFLFDENCVLQRDTVVIDSEPERRYKASAIFPVVFGDTTGWLPNSWTTFVYSPDYQSFITIAYAVKPSIAWRTRMSRTPCGIGIRLDESCFRRGPLELRMMDSIHAVIAVRGFRMPNKPVDDLFLVTLSRPNAALASQSMQHGIVNFQSGALYVENFLALQPRFWLGTPDSRGLAGARKLPGVRAIEDVIGVAHHTGTSLTLEQITRLKPASRCAGLPGSCYEVDGRAIEFP